MDNNEVSVIPLGTVSPYPKGNLNCPGFLVMIGKYKILLDCGNGISKMFKYPDAFNDLIIIISHLHNDHFADLGAFAYTSYVYHKLGKLNNKVKVLIPNKDIKSTYAYDYLKNLDNSYLDIENYDGKTNLNYGGADISFIKNLHDITTYSTKIKYYNKTIVYSSDTGYEFDHLDLFAKNADLLICESTFLYDQKGDNNFHLSAFDAGMIAMAADVKKLMLTHFFPEIDKQKYVIEAQKMFENTIAAEEGKKLVLK